MTPRRCFRQGAKWTLPRYKREWRNICAILPIYLDDGTNGTTVTYLDGTADHIGYRLSWVLGDLLGYLHTSVEVLTAQSRLYLGKNARRVPLIVSPELCLVPVKGREAFTGNESLMGYIVMNYVADVLPGDAQNMVCFIGGTSITVLDNIGILWANLNLAKELMQKTSDK